MIRHRIVVGVALAALALSLIPGVAPGAWPQHPLGEQEREALLAELGPQNAALLRLRGATRRVSFEMQASTTEILEHLAERGGFEIELRGVQKDVIHDLRVRDTTIAAALTLLGLEYEVDTDGTTLAAYSAYRIGGEIQAPRRIEYSAPSYPDSARREGVQGIVVLEATIATDGTVAHVEILRGVSPDLDAAAQAAVYEWVYTPTLHEGTPVVLELTVTVQFQLQ